MSAWQGIALFGLLLACVVWGLRTAALRLYDAQFRRPSSFPVPPDGEVEEETIALLTAAAIAVLGRQVRLRRVRFLQRRGDSAWAVTGRLNIMASHLVRKGNL